ncbi:MAG: SRPBCC family protein [Saprospiraceae bacterium]|nr:SRPBCC family protein [Saprospiraceae bacterium]
MKLLISIFKILFVLAIIYLIAALLGKSSYRVERESVINAPQKLVYNQISIFRNWEKWSPWAEKDPTVKNTYEGPDGEAGAIMNWTGDKDISGTGSIKVEASNPPNGFNYVLNFKVPFEMQSRGGFMLSAASDEKTKIIWHDQGDIAFIFRPMMMFMDMDKQMGPDFERGLFKIDSVCAGIYSEMKKVMLQDTLQKEMPNLQ